MKKPADTFSARVKREIIARPPPVPCCLAAACYGIACFARHFDARGVELHTDSEEIACWAEACYAQAGISGTARQRGAAGSWEFAVRDAFEAEKLLAMFSHSVDEPALRIRRENFECGQCASFFIAAAFLCCGTVLNPEKGYMLEFVSPRRRLMRDFAELLSQRGLEPKTALRGGAGVIYFKASEYVEDILTTVGATACALEIMNLKIFKDFRNRANRVTNCETANIDKIVAANRQTLEALRLLEARGALQTLPQPLREAALLRRAYPDLGLEELAKRSKTPVSKSGLSHRYAKIREKAAELRALQPAKRGQTRGPAFPGGKRKQDV